MAEEIHVKKIPGLTAPYYNLGDYFPRMDEAQDLTPEQLAQIRDNINVPLSSDSNTPFGATGMRVVLESYSHAHMCVVLFGVADAGKWVLVYRKALDHDVEHGSEVRAIDSYDKGVTWGNDRLVYTSSSSDTRNFVGTVGDNGDLLILATRRVFPDDYLDPVRIVSSNGGETWGPAAVTNIAINRPVNFHGHMHRYPASVGGDDTQGFIAYSYGNPNIDAYFSLNNGRNWTGVQDVAEFAAPLSRVGEPTVVRIGNSDRWLMYCRPSGGDMLAVFTSTDMLNWSPMADAGLIQKANPPHAIYKDGRIWLMSFSRTGRDIVPGFDNHIMAVSADAEELWAAGGVFSALNPAPEWAVLAEVPRNAVGYMCAVEIGGRWYAPFTAGEVRVQEGPPMPSSIFMIGDFIPSTADAARIPQLTYRDDLQLRIKNVTAPANFSGAAPLDMLMTAAMVAAGAVVEYGTTPDGTFYRFESGLQVCWNGDIGSVQSNEAVGDVFRSPTIIWTFPKPFLDTSYFASILPWQNTSAWPGGIGKLAYSCSARYMTPAADSTARIMTGFAIGLWKPIA